MVRTRLEIHVLEHAVEVVHDSDIVTVREYLRITRRAGDAEPAVRPPRNRVVVAAGRISVRIRAARAVVDAEREARVIHVRSIRHNRDDARSNHPRHDHCPRHVSRSVRRPCIGVVAIPAVVPIVALIPRRHDDVVPWCHDSARWNSRARNSELARAAPPEPRGGLDRDPRPADAVRLPQRPGRRPARPREPFR